MGLPRPLRAVVLSWHIIAAAGWFVLLASAVAFPWYQFEGLLLVDVSVALGTGLVLALTGPVGLVRHWWTIGKLVGSALLLVAGGLALCGHYLPWSRLAGLVVLWLLVWVSVTRPWGKTAYGRAITRPYRGRHGA